MANREIKFSGQIFQREAPIPAHKGSNWVFCQMFGTHYSHLLKTTEKFWGRDANATLTSTVPQLQKYLSVPAPLLLTGSGPMYTNSTILHSIAYGMQAAQVLSRPVITLNFREVDYLKHATQKKKKSA